MIVPPSPRVPPRKNSDDLAMFVIIPALCSAAVAVLGNQSHTGGPV
jgi:hypothetical protein